MKTATDRKGKGKKGPTGSGGEVFFSSDDHIFGKMKERKKL